MLIIGNGTVLTFDKDSRVISNGGVVIEEENIISIGETEKLISKYPEAILKDVQGKIIMPGMINTHMHLYSTFARGMDLKTDQPPKNFVEILEKLWWRLDKVLNEEDIYCSAIYALLDCVKKGATTIFDHHASSNIIDGSLDIITEAVRQTGIRANLSYEISDRDGHKKALEGIRENERFIKKTQRETNSYLKGIIGLHASFTLKNETLSQSASLADNLKVPFHIHVAEGIEDFYESKSRGYKGVAERLNRFHILRPGTLAIHGVHLQEKELEILKNSESYLIHNPESNMGNAVGTAPIKSAIDKGVMVGLGTDGYTSDMFESIKVANLLQKHESHNPQAGWEEVFQMAFQNNREIAARFFGRTLGILQVGAPADIIVVNYYPPTPITSENAYFHILFGISGDMVDTTIVGGNILMEDREISTLDYERITKRVKEQAKDFWKRF
ncbi:MAG TPA: putative aminohydrolase SsnA [Candidatus Atribacteria bacterium]|nr:putative aminohydrolase SsnA [Candidatus Atribacteria bacterium]